MHYTIDKCCRAVKCALHNTSHQPSYTIYLGDNDSVIVAHTNIGNDRDRALIRSGQRRVTDNPASCVTEKVEVDEVDVAAKGNRKE